MDEIADEAWIATAAAIGAPAGTTQWQMLGVDYIKAVELAQRELGAPIYGLMIGQNGKSSTLNGWLPGAVLGTKVVDAVGDLRAHPTGDMGSIGLANSPEPMIQSAAEATAQTTRISSLSCAEPPREFLPYCGAPPTCRAASLRRVAIPSAPPMSRRTLRSAASRSRLRSARLSSPRSAKAAPR